MTEQELLYIKEENNGYEDEVPDKDPGDEESQKPDEEPDDSGDDFDDKDDDKDDEDSEDEWLLVHLSFFFKTKTFYSIKIFKCVWNRNLD